MTLTELIIYLSLPTVVTAISLLLIAVACVLKWKRIRSKLNLAMMLGTLITVAAGPLISWISTYTREGGEIEPGVYSTQAYWWDQYLPYLGTVGFFIFSAGFLYDNIINKEGSNKSRGLIAGTRGATD